MGLSIVVPVYNCEKYVGDCIMSILEQEYKETELILVNDGSTDRSLDVCLQFTTDSRVKIVSQKNKGALAARYVGTLQAKYEYITYVDSDDWIISDYYKILMDNISDADIISAGLEQFNEVGDFTSKRKLQDGMPVGIYEGEGLKYFFENLIYKKGTSNGGLLITLGTKVYRTELMKRTMDCISKKLRHNEDSLILYTYLLHCNKIKVVDVIGYCVRHRSGSLSRVRDESFLEKNNLYYLEAKKQFVNSQYAFCLLPQLQKNTVQFVFDGITRKMGFDENVLPIKYLVPPGMVSQGEKVVLYGAGCVGRDYHRQLKKSGYMKVVLWVDKNPIIKESINKVDELLNIEFDKVLIAVLRNDVAAEITNELIRKGICKDKIVWSEPVTVFD